MSNKPLNIESVGEKFSLEGLKEARELGWRAIEEIQNQIKVGMTEREAVRMASQAMSAMGFTRHWHAPIIRLGPGTLKSFRDPLDDTYRLKETDIFYIDIGPVWSNAHEVDVGASFSVGEDPELRRCTEDAENIFKAVAKKWREEKLSGTELYSYAESSAQDRGWELLPMDAGGHRISDFPHKLHYSGNLKDQDFNPSPFVWILEIHIKHPQKPFAAFYEDLLF